MLVLSASRISSQLKCVLKVGVSILLATRLLKDRISPAWGRGTFGTEPDASLQEQEAQPQMGQTERPAKKCDFWTTGTKDRMIIACYLVEDSLF